MKKYVVTVYETRQREIEVEAESADQAREEIKERWCQRGHLRLDEMDFDHVTIEAETSPKQREKITYLYVPVGKPPEVRTIVNDPENIRGLLKAHPIARLFEEDVALMSQGNGAPLNRALYGEKHDLNSIIQGNFFIVNAPWYQSTYESLTPEQIKKYRERFQYPEKFVKNGDEFSVISIKTKPKAHAR
jgi:hypothetical protein